MFNRFASFPTGRTLQQTLILLCSRAVIFFFPRALLAWIRPCFDVVGAGEAALLKQRSKHLRSVRRPSSCYVSACGTQRIQERRSFESAISTIFLRFKNGSKNDSVGFSWFRRFHTYGISDVSDFIEQRRTNELLGKASLSACVTRSGARFGPRQKTSERSRLICQRQRIEYDPSSQLSREVRQPCARQHDRQQQRGKEERPGASCQPTVLADGGYPQFNFAAEVHDAVV